MPTLLGVACIDMNLILTTNPYPNPNPYPNQVGCIDMNLVVALDTVRARDDWNDFDARVTSERAACPRVVLTEPQLETLRRGVSEAAVCGSQRKTVVLTIMASGDLSDYDSGRIWSLRQKIANAAGVDASLVTISVAAASVLITATIVVPASTTAEAVQTSLAATLGTAATASAALGVTVVSTPTIVVAEPPGSLQQEGSTSLEGASSDTSTAITVVLVAGLILMLAAGTCGAIVRYRRMKRFRMPPQFLDVDVSVSPMYASNFPTESKMDQFAPL